MQKLPVTKHRQRNVAIFIGLIGINFILLYFQTSLQSSTFSIFQERDITRAEALLEGNLIFFGPELSGGSNLPGPFYYYLLTPPLMLGLSWIGAWCWMFILFSLGGTAGWYFFKTKYDVSTAFIWVIASSTIPLTTNIIQNFMNPSFSFLFIMLINIYILKAFSEDNLNLRNRAFILACFLVGLSIQLHYVNIVYIFSLITLHLIGKKINLPRIDTKKFYLGLLIFTLTATPYFIWLILRKNGYNLGQALLYDGDLTHSLSTLSMRAFLISDFSVNNFLLKTLRHFFNAVPFILLIYLLLQIFFKSKNKTPDVQAKPAYVHHVKILGICLFFAALPFLLYLLPPYVDRYATPFSITTCFFVVVAFGILSGNNKKIVTIITVLVVGFLSLGLNYIVKQKSTPRSAIKLPPTYQQWEKVWTKIISDTGWSYSEAAERVYIINQHIDQSPKKAYQVFLKNELKNSSSLLSFPDGYFVSFNKINKKNETLPWILEQPIDSDIRSGLLNGDIILGDHDADSDVLVAPYFVINTKNLPAHFHNLGLGYNELPEEKIFRKYENNNLALKIAKNSYLFKWNECLRRRNYCNTGAIVNLSPAHNHNYMLDIKIIGASLSQVSVWIIPGWTQAWIEPYFEFKCNGKATTLKIASSIGYNSEYLKYYPGALFSRANNSILAPYKRNFKIHCKGDLSEISIGRAASVAERFLNVNTLAKQKLTIKLSKEGL